MQIDNAPELVEPLFDSLSQCSHGGTYRDLQGRPSIPKRVLGSNCGARVSITWGTWLWFRTFQNSIQYPENVIGKNVATFCWHPCKVRSRSSGNRDTCSRCCQRVWEQRAERVPQIAACDSCLHDRAETWFAAFADLHWSLVCFGSHTVWVYNGCHKDFCESAVHSFPLIHD